MANDGNDDDFGKELAAAFEADESPAEITPPKADDTTTPPAPEAPKVEEPKKNETAAPEVPKPGEAPTTPPADPTKKPEDGTTPPQAPETPPAAPVEEPPKPLTMDDLKSVVEQIRTEERTSGKALENQTQEVLEAYYPDGLSNVLIDQGTGKELRTPQDVVELTNGEMSLEQAQQWLMNEQYKVDQNIAKIKDDAKNIAETTLKFKQDSVDVLTRYEPLFKRYPQVQEKIWGQYKKLIKADEAKGVILSAPDMREFYDTVLDPYRIAFEYETQQSATNPTPPAGTPPATPPPATPGVNDRLDEGGDGGASPVDDPNDFAQQVKKELAKGF